LTLKGKSLLLFNYWFSIVNCEIL